MTGNIWMCSRLLDTDDLEFGKHEFITYKMGQEYYGMLSRMELLQVDVLRYIQQLNMQKRGMHIWQE